MSLVLPILRDGGTKFVFVKDWRLSKGDQSNLDANSDSKRQRLKMKTYEHKVSYIDKVEYEEFKKCVLLKAELHMPNPKLYDGWNFVSKKEWKRLLKEHTPVEAAKRLTKSYIYPIEELREDMKTMPISFFSDPRYIKKYNFFEDGVGESALDVIKKNDFEKDLLWFDWANYECFEIDDDIPVNSPLYYDYISGRISTAYVDLKKAKEILEKNKYVSKVEEIEIGWYNQDTCGKRALQFVLHPPRDKWRELVKMLTKESEECPTLRAKEILIGQGDSKKWSKFNILNIKTAHRGLKSHM